MLENWLSPVSKKILSWAKTLPPDSVAANLTFFSDKMPNLRKTKIALIGLNSSNTDAIRSAFYQYKAQYPSFSIADIGNLRNDDNAALIPVLGELLAGKIVPVVLGGFAPSVNAQFLAYQENKEVVNWVAIDETTRFGQFPEPSFNALLKPKHPALFHFGLIGNQGHFCNMEAIQILENQNFENLSLGKCRSSLEATEPLIRDADMLSFHISALKMSDAPAVQNASPAGLLSEEACQICRYAGISDKLTSFGIYGFETTLDQCEQTAQVVAQMVFYFLDGYFSRKNDFPASTDGLTEYIVEMPALNYQITFWKSIRSGRWWMQIPIEKKRKLNRHQLIPCSYQDYVLATQGELPDRLMRAFLRFN